jgi:arylsulfatase A-like enzyme
MFSSDNGPWYQGSAGALRGRKGSTYEGGVREPFQARFPGKIPKGLHFARYNTFAFSPAPAGGRVNLALRPPELYDVENDPMESYDVATENPSVVREIQSRVEHLLMTFPAEVKKAWADTQSRETAVTPAGALPRKK